MKNQLFHRNELLETPWKNGNGITREITCSDKGEAYWRLSIADVTKEGEFSSFPGLERILTVIEGEGMRLRSSEESMEAKPWQPVSFSGEQSVTGSLIKGPVQNFNVMYDAEKLAVKVTVLSSYRSPSQLSLDPVLDVVYCLSGEIQFKERTLYPHEGIILSKGYEMAFKEKAMALKILIRQLI